MNNKYELLKEWPDAEIGDVYQWNGQGYSNQNRAAMVITKKYVECYPDWFQRVYDKIEVTRMWEEDREEFGRSLYCFYTTSPFPEDKFPAIRRILERIINDEDASYEGVPAEDLKQIIHFWRENSQIASDQLKEARYELRKVLNSIENKSHE